MLSILNYFPRVEDVQKDVQTQMKNLQHRLCSQFEQMIIGHSGRISGSDSNEKIIKTDLEEFCDDSNTVSVKPQHWRYPLAYYLAGSVCAGSWYLNLGWIYQDIAYAHFNPALFGVAGLSTSLSLAGGMALQRLMGKGEANVVLGRRFSSLEYCLMLYLIIAVVPVSWAAVAHWSKVSFILSKNTILPYKLGLPGLLGAAAIFEEWHPSIMGLLKDGELKGVKKKSESAQNTAVENTEKETHKSKKQIPSFGSVVAAEVEAELEAVVVQQLCASKASRPSTSRPSVSASTDAPDETVEEDTLLVESDEESEFVSSARHTRRSSIQSSRSSPRKDSSKSPIRSPKKETEKQPSKKSTIQSILKDFEDISINDTDLEQLKNSMIERVKAVNSSTIGKKSTIEGPSQSDEKTADDSRLSKLMSEKGLQLQNSDAELLAIAWEHIKDYFETCEGTYTFAALQGVFMAFDLGVDYAMAQWKGAFFDTFQTKNFAKFQELLKNFVFIALANIVSGAYADYMVSLWDLHCREFFVRSFALKGWFQHAGYYKMGLQAGDRLHNCDQRIHEDVTAFIGGSRKLSFGFVDAVARLMIFLPQLISMAPAGVWQVSVIISLASSVITHTVGKPMIPANMQMQNAEASFRQSLIRVRDKAEAFALAADLASTNGNNSDARTDYRVVGSADLTVGQSANDTGGSGQSANDTGDALALSTGGAELSLMDRKFKDIKMAIWNSMQIGFYVGSYTSAYSLIAGILPFLLLAPSFFNGAISMGTMFQIETILAQCQGSLSFFISTYGDIAGWRVTTDRLAQMERFVRESQQKRLAIEVVNDYGVENLGNANVVSNIIGEPLLQSSRLVNDIISTTNGFDVQFEWLGFGDTTHAKDSTHSKDSTCIFHNLRFQLLPGDKKLVLGDGNAGKSVLLRALARIWPEQWQEAKWFSRPKKNQIVCVPQTQNLFTDRSCFLEALGGQTVQDIPLVLDCMRKCGLGEEFKEIREQNGVVYQGIEGLQSDLMNPDLLSLFLSQFNEAEHFLSADLIARLTFALLLVYQKKKAKAFFLVDDFTTANAFECEESKKLSSLFLDSLSEDQACVFFARDSTRVSGNHMETLLITDLECESVKDENQIQNEKNTTPIKVIDDDPSKGDTPLGKGDTPIDEDEDWTPIDGGNNDSRVSGLNNDSRVEEYRIGTPSEEDTPDVPVDDGKKRTPVDD